jgi:hypothetical protein
VELNYNSILKNVFGQASFGVERSLASSMNEELN